MFTSVDYDNEYMYYLLRNILSNDETIDDFLLLLNQNKAYITGSLILQLIKQAEYTKSDMDIVIEVYNEDDVDFLSQVFKFLNDNSFRSEYNISAYNTCSAFIAELDHNPNGMYDNISYSYYSNSLIKSVSKFTNSVTKKSIDIILIQSDITVFLSESFDFDIVKNYYANNKVYAFNPNIRTVTIATVTNYYFINQICSRPDKLLKFIIRVDKYIKRGFAIFVGKTHLTNGILLFITKMMTMYKFVTRNNKRIFYYTDLQYNEHHDLNICSVGIELKSHIAKILVFSYLQQRNTFIKKLELYSNYLTEEYLHPDSIYVVKLMNAVKAMMLDGEISHDKGVYYVTVNNSIKLLKFAPE